MVTKTSMAYCQYHYSLLLGHFTLSMPCLPGGVWLHISIYFKLSVSQFYVFGVTYPPHTQAVTHTHTLSIYEPKCCCCTHTASAIFREQMVTHQSWCHREEGGEQKLGDRWQQYDNVCRTWNGLYSPTPSAQSHALSFAAKRDDYILSESSQFDRYAEQAAAAAVWASFLATPTSILPMPISLSKLVAVSDTMGDWSLAEPRTEDRKHDPNRHFSHPHRASERQRSCAINHVLRSLWRKATSP